MTPHCLITARRRSTRTLVRVGELIRDGRNPASPSALIDLRIADFTREVRARLATLAAELDPMESLLIERREAGRLTDLGGLLAPRAARPPD
jgi:hypothetical protein